MKIHPKSCNPPQAGSALLFVLVLVAIVSLVFVGWIEIMTARSNLTEVFSYSVQRRIAQQNSRAMLQEYLAGIAIQATSGSLSPAVMAKGTDASWGSLELLPWTKDPAAWQNPGVPPNSFNLGGSGAYDPPIQAFFGQSITIAEEAATESVTRSMVGVVRTRSWADIPTPDPSQTIDGAAEKLAGDAPLWYVCDGAGNVSIILADAPSEVGVTSVANLTLIGDQSTADAPMTLRMDLQSESPLVAINSTGSNLRPLTIALRQPIAAPRLDWTLTEDTVWIADVVLVDAAIQLFNGASFQGFLLTNSTVLPSSLPPRIVRPGGWNEIYLSPPVP